MTEESDNDNLLVDNADKVIEQEVFNASLVDGRGAQIRAALLYVQLKRTCLYMQH